MSFRPPLWATLVTLSAMLAFSSLANWQYQRGQDKAAIIAAQVAAALEPALPVRQGDDLPDWGRRVALRGRWQGGQEVLLDNQTHQHRNGVHVLTPLRLLVSGELVLVNRGWVEASAYREKLPDTGRLPDDVVTVTGMWRDLPRAGISRADTQGCSPAVSWPQRLNYPAHDELLCLYGAPLARGLVQLDPDAADGFVRRWADFGVPPARHYGYAVQWGALALTALVLYLVLNLKRSRS